MATSSSAALTQRDYSEKRNFHRMTLNTSIEISIPENKETVGGFCLNLSSAGLMFRIQEPLTEGQECMTFIESGSPSTNDLKATIRITRCEADDPNGYVVGAEIVEFH